MKRLNESGATLIEYLTVLLAFLMIPGYIFGIPYLVWKAYLYAIVIPFHSPVLTYWQVFCILFIIQVFGGLFKITIKKKKE